MLRRCVVTSFLLLGLFEFYSALQWWSNAEAEQRATEGLLPAACTMEVFVVAWCVYLVTLGLVRISVYLSSNLASTLWISTLVHLPETLFWWYWALKPTYLDGEDGIVAFLLEVCKGQRGFFAMLVLIGPGLLVCIHLYLIATAALPQEGKSKDQ
jgi:hypothetical protein|tara:strand:- start:311 stop:775 length:465 start_codon:yes stop_codon:yes gene_type:complete